MGYLARPERRPPRSLPPSYTYLRHSRHLYYKWKYYAMLPLSFHERRLRRRRLREFSVPRFCLLRPQNKVISNRNMLVFLCMSDLSILCSANTVTVFLAMTIYTPDSSPNLITLIFFSSWLDFTKTVKNSSLLRRPRNLQASRYPNIASGTTTVLRENF